MIFIIVYLEIFTGLKFFLTRTGPITVGASYLCGLRKK